MKISAKHILITNMIFSMCLLSAINSREALALVGLPDVGPHGDLTDGHFNKVKGRTNPVYWDSRDLKIGNTIYPNELKDHGPKIGEGIQSALRIWEHAANITFERCTDVDRCPDSMIINIGAGHTPGMSIKDDGTPYEQEPIGKWQTGGGIPEYSWVNSKYFIDGPFWFFNTLTGLYLSYGFIETLSHEIGHALGLQHLTDLNTFDGVAIRNVMDASITIPNRLGYAAQASVWDIQHIESLYGPSLLEPDIKTFYLDGSVGYQNIGEGPGDTNPGNYSFYGDGGVASETVNNKPTTPPYTLWKFMDSGGHPFSPAKDPDGNPLTYSIIKSPVHGKATTSGNKLDYVPAIDFVGTDSFEYRAADPYGLFADGVVNVSVLPHTDLMVVNKNGNGTVVSEPEGINCGPVCLAEFPRGSNVTLRTIPAQDSVFRQWGANCIGAGSCAVTMNSFKSITADFGPAPTSFALTVDKNGNGSGRVSAPSIDCGTDCTNDYAIYANLTLTATPNNGSIFKGWSGACSGKDACTIWMYNDKTVTATFSSSSVLSIVVTHLNDSGPGSLRQAILDANANVGNDIIVFESGTSGTINLTTGQLEITEAVTLDGPGADVVAISGNNASRIFRVDPAGLNETVAIDGLTLTESNDVSGNGGGAMIIDSGTVTISNSVLSNNAADIGGGGGAIRKLGLGSLSISNSTVSGNSAFDEFRQGEGGGIRNDQGALTITNSTVSGNTSANGGGIAMDDGTLTILSSTVSDNSATNSGGGIFNSSGAFEQPGGLILGNSVVAGNTAITDKEIQNFGVLTSKGHNLFGENGASGVTEGTILATSDLILAGLRSSAIGPLADNGGQTQTHLPVAGGPTIDAGENLLIPLGLTTDQRGIGFPRIMNDTVDIGAVERIVKPKPDPTECLFNWAEGNYPALFAPSGSLTAVFSVYNYRYYSETNAYLGVSSSDNNVYYMGADGILQNVGALSTWLPVAGCQ